MAPTKLPKLQPSGVDEAIEEDEKLSQATKELLLSLPRERGWRTPYVYLFQGFWCSSRQIQAIITFQKHFQAKDSDVLVATVPKSGTTWLKALTFATMNRHHFSCFTKNHPLLTSNPHDLVPFFEFTVYANHDDKVPDLSNMHEPRIFGTHVPFASLPSSIKESNCKVIYICRNPFDTFVSFWIFADKTKPGSLPTLPLEEAFEMYCKGVSVFGPFWTHMLGYWKESVESPNKVLFLMYEDLIEDVNFHLKRVAEFLGCPFTLEEESSGVIEGITKLCSFEKMKELEVNKHGTCATTVENKYYFRKGEVGDWVNYLSPSMAEKLTKVIEEKLGGSGLSFRMNS
ncbi:cytosolic sulfotransferase 15 [Cajanus cajan]|uniref:Sulfotransferase n=1 Tax=Cajanus cajan TaxID=3821 RepID=A0A151RCP9_CAJCA|nr:cytosolic sulfotransferase 15 [Cajanus cajan]KYP40155.1 hypothetical protein KK1_038524 [Cajanus cajan]